MNSKSKAGFFILQVMLVKTGLLHKYLSQKAGVSFQSARKYIERKCCELLKMMQAIKSFFVCFEVNRTAITTHLFSFVC